jgi:hypothetical protein
LDFDLIEVMKNQFAGEEPNHLAILEVKNGGSASYTPFTGQRLDLSLKEYQLGKRNLAIIQAY